MGFRILQNTSPVSITIDTLTPAMIQDLIKFYAADVDPASVEARSPAGTISAMDYPIIPKQVVEALYDQLDRVTIVIKDVILGHFHTDDVFREDEQYEVDGSPCATVEELEHWTYHIIKRDFYTEASWLYSFSNGDFESLRPFINYCIYLFILVNDHGDFDQVCLNIRNAFGNE